jgi:hypothetical protein
MIIHNVSEKSVFVSLGRSKLIHSHTPATLPCRLRHVAIHLSCPDVSQSRALSASIRQLAGSLRDLVMSDSSSPPPSPTASVNYAKRVEDHLSIDSSVGGESSDDVPDSEKDTIVVKSLDADDSETFQLRAYQDEMLEASLKRNTIVVLNTGAGKTHM